MKFVRFTAYSSVKSADTSFFFPVVASTSVTAGLYAERYFNGSLVFISAFIVNTLNG